MINYCTLPLYFRVELFTLRISTHKAGRRIYVFVSERRIKGLLVKITPLNRDPKFLRHPVPSEVSSW
jgi:hypothetical protein